MQENQGSPPVPDKTKTTRRGFFAKFPKLQIPRPSPFFDAQSSDPTSPINQTDLAKMGRQSAPTIEPLSPISRREFLKRAAVTFAFLELSTGVLNDVMKSIETYFRQAGILSEGNAVQFMTTLESLTREMLLDPTAENQQLLAAWLKFNGAIHYGARSNMELAAHFVNHFLYGDGSDLHVEPQVSRMAQDLVQNLSDEERQALGITGSLSDIEAVKLLAQEMLAENRLANDIFNDQGTFVRSADDPSQYFAGSGLSQLAGRNLGVFGVGYSGDRALMNSLGAFSVFFDGEQAEIENGTVTLHNTELSIYDRYDWSESRSLGQGAQIGTIIEGMGLEALFANPLFDDLKNEMIEILDGEGKLLVDHGLAHNFQIAAEFGNVGTVSVRLQSATPPTPEFLSRIGGELTKLE